MSSHFLFLIIVELALPQALLQWPKIGFVPGVVFMSVPDVLGQLVKPSFMFIWPFFNSISRSAMVYYLIMSLS